MAKIALTLLAFSASSLCAAQPAVRPADLDALEQEVVTLCRSDHCEEAIPLYKQLADLQPNDVDALKDLMYALWDAGRIRDTIGAGERAARQSPNDADILNVLGRAYLAANEPDKALRSYRKLLQLSPESMPVALNVSRLYADLKDYDEAERLLEDTRVRFPESPEIYPRLARVEFLKGQFHDASKDWAKAVENFPERSDYRYERARSLYFDGRFPAALAQMESLLGDAREKRLALDFLTDDALARGNWEEAAHRLQDNLKSFDWTDQPRLLKLAEAYHKTGKLDDCIKTTDRCLLLNPRNAAALDAKAVCLLEQGKIGESKKPNEQIFAWNSSALFTLAHLANTYEAEGNSALAARTLTQALAADATDPYLLLADARALYGAGQRQKARAMLLHWLQTNRAPVLPVFLYHGLTPFQRDPILAYSVHLTTQRFEEHMRALVQAHFTPVTASQVDRWIHGKAELPERPVMIAFDDNRMDSFRQADPVLKRTGVKATMFTIVHYANLHLPHYASWQEIKRYVATGRWEIQSHGDSAHLPIPVDREGHEAMFLVNKKWLAKEHRMETDAEWKRRIELDHLSAKQWIGQFTGQRPVAYAWPEGNFGQIGVSNAPNAATVNLAAARAAYGSTYHQDSFGLNTRTRDPMQLTRYEPHQAETGEDIMRHIQDKNPFAMMRSELVHWSAWAGRTREAFGWLEELRKNGASQQKLWLDEAEIRAEAGDLRNARSLAEKVNDQEPLPAVPGEPSESERLLTAIALKERSEWSPGFYYFSDSRDRQNWSLHQSFSWRRGDWDWTAHQAHASYRDLNDIRLSEERLGLAATRHFGLYHTAEGELLGHIFSSEAPNAVSVRAGARSQWSDDFGTKFEVGRVPMETGQALRQGIRMGYGEAGVTWTRDLWKAEPDVRWAALTDGNRRTSGRFKLSRGFFSPESGPHGVYRLDYEDMPHASSYYYAPRNLQEHQLGMEWAEKWNRFEGSAGYLPGVGKEDGVSAMFIQDAELRGIFHATERAALCLTFDWSKTPTYRQTSTDVSFVWKF